MEKKRMASVGVIGDGAWGTTLAKLLAQKGCRVALWGAFPDNLKKIASEHENKKYLPGVQLPKNILLEEDLVQLVRDNTCLLLAVPSQYLVSVLENIKKCDIRGKAFVSVVKGIDENNFKTMSQLTESFLGKVPFAVLSGPTIAIEVAREIPTTAVVASRDRVFMKEAQHVFSNGYFRVYTNPDVPGVEICGSLKNIIAIACGICDGLGFGTNTKAAILTRGLVEMVRLGRHFRAKPQTFYGLTGLGDLATTCFSPNSRNRYVGEEIGKGKGIKAVLSSMNSVAEGVLTTKAVYGLSLKLKIDMPITKAVYDILYQRCSPRKVVSALMLRSLKRENSLENEVCSSSVGDD